MPRVVIVARADRYGQDWLKLRSDIKITHCRLVRAYNLACSESLSGHPAAAIDHLRRAVGASEKLRADAREDSDFDAIRDEPSFKALIGE